jgi:hypothetical protein
MTVALFVHVTTTLQILRILFLNRCLLSGLYTHICMVLFNEAHIRPSYSCRGADDEVAPFRRLILSN